MEPWRDGRSCRVSRASTARGGSESPRTPAQGRREGPEPPLVRVHLADTLRDLLGLQQPARAWTLRAAMQRIVEAGSGVGGVLRNQESAHELADALRGLAIESAPEAGEGTVLRTFGVGAQILKDLGVRR